MGKKATEMQELMGQLAGIKTTQSVADEPIVQEKFNDNNLLTRIRNQVVVQNQVVPEQHSMVKVVKRIYFKDK